MEPKFSMIALALAVASAVAYIGGLPFISGVLCMACVDLVFMAWLFGHRE